MGVFLYSFEELLWLATSVPAIIQKQREKDAFAGRSHNLQAEIVANMPENWKRKRDHTFITMLPVSLDVTIKTLVLMSPPLEKCNVFVSYSKWPSEKH